MTLPGQHGPRCEHRQAPEAGLCSAQAFFRVSRSGRESDAEVSCRRHLAATVTALEQGEGVAVAVRVIRRC